MMRTIITLGRPQAYEFTDAVHAAIVQALTRSGIPAARLIGVAAAPWTFGIGGRRIARKLSTLRTLTISTTDAEIGDAFRRLEPDAMSRPGSQPPLDFSTARKTLPFRPAFGPEALFYFASPFVVSIGPKTVRTKTQHATTLSGIDLSAAFSRGLSRRLGRDVGLDVAVDPLTLRTEGAAPRVVPVRRTPGRRDIYFPAFALPLTVRGRPEDIEAAYFAGLGEKTRYGFGCPILPR
ncbi:MAG: CRISPR-associated endoribonuclease Cas6 [Hyphomicrobiaceae bacterium]